MTAAAQRVALLGATGSIGQSALDVMARHPQRFAAHVVTAHQNLEALLHICETHHPAHAVIADEAQYVALKEGLAQRGLRTQAHAGAQALVDVVQMAEVDTVLAAIVGAAGLPSALAAAKAGKRILLANKEAIVMAGALFMRSVRDAGGVLLPIDSEHNAILQCLQGARDAVRKVVLTASGGPFLHHDAAALYAVTPDQACAHPKWSMGRKISVDSATLMNKGLELIEARWLFDLPPEQLDVVVHPQSIVHALVHYHDGSCVSQLGLPDMRTAISVALAHPQRMLSGVADLDLIAQEPLHFLPPDRVLFPCLALAEQAMYAGGDASIVLNAANEVAVAAFLHGRLGFMDIPALAEAMLERATSQVPHDLAEIMERDAEVRHHASNWIEARA